MPPIKDAAGLSGTNMVSSFAGVVLMVSLHCRCRRHLEASRERDRTHGLSYSFWSHHYELDEALTFFTTKIVGHIDQRARLDDPLALCLFMNVCAVNICLHEVAVAKADEGNLPATVAVESRNRCEAAAKEIVSGVRLSRQLDSSKVGCTFAYIMHSLK